MESIEYAEWLVFAGVVVAVAIVGSIYFYWAERQKLAQMTPEDREQYLAEQEKLKREEQEREREQQLAEQWGPVNPAMVCPHCQEKGMIRTRQVSQKKGVSGGKAAAAVLTGGWSILATGLSRKESATQAHCENCNNTWVF